MQINGNGQGEDSNGDLTSNEDLSNNLSPIDLRRTGNVNYSITQLWDSHREILRRLAIGESPTRIASELDITTQTISNVRNSPLAMDRLEFLQDIMDKKVVDINERIHNISGEAMAILEDIMGDKRNPVGLRAKIANEFLDKAGHSPPKKISIDKREVICNIDFINRIKERSRNAIESKKIEIFSD